ncbi:MAG TPA: DUF4127 family protein, partial [Caldilineae bacterium]|nr:DUF4127 family protein [Caldilineae bacterium]
RGNATEEEKPYWATYGARMFRLSYLTDKANIGDASPEEIAERDRLAAELPEEIVRDYLDGRARNHAVNRVAHLRLGSDREGLRAHLAHLFWRLLDDYLYQVIARTEVMLMDLPALGLEPMMTELPRDVDAVQERVAARLLERAGPLSSLFRDASISTKGWPEISEISVHDIHLPWKRLFEIGCQIEVHFVDDCGKTG